MGLQTLPTREASQDISNKETNYLTLTKVVGVPTRRGKVIITQNVAPWLQTRLDN